MQGMFQAGMRALGTAGENYIIIIGRLRWTIHISSDCLWDLARLEGRSEKFLEGSSAGNRGRFGSKNCAIPPRSWQHVVRGLLGKNVH